MNLEGGEPRFFLADGTEVGAEVAAKESREALATAEAALRRLGLGAAEARRLAERASNGGESSPAEVVRAALRAMPAVSAS